ncbi:MAG TPA: GNAT family N-acetyltransferase [Tissierellaceae bacterium]|nr:GNAT family N-acetyltransferase [Tissierellaceae bacterium]
MREIRRLNKSHIDAYSSIAFNAYPSFKDLSDQGIREYKENLLRIMQTDPQVSFYGMFEGEKLIAVMRLFDFTMNLFGKMVASSGAGYLGVHLMHKKDKCAKEMMEFYEDFYRSKGIPIGLLLPFRPDFYKKMGYGIGSKMNQYRIDSSRIPSFYGPSDLRYVDGDDINKLIQCHTRVARKGHGMIMKIKDEIRNLKNDPYIKIIGHYDEEDNITGYLAFKFENAKDNNYTINNINIMELIYEDTDVLKKLLGFLRKQEDQVSLVIFNTQDEYFHYLFDNPMNDTLNYVPYGNLETNTQAVGLMYKLFNIEKAFEESSHRNYNNSNLNIRFLVYDEMKKEELELVLNFKDGKAHIGKDKFDGTIKINLANLSSLYFASVSVIGLHNLGLLEIDNIALLEELDSTFYYPQKPRCNTDF